ncbi:MAG: hypothetical protein LQ351_005582 [Letrouitia transgressa]|nr:MAG: hypothetical protein LQ351_005582 [Letrouitia transgressa]
MVQKVYVTYNEVHKLCQASADRILNDFQPNLMIAIGGGGYVPARILRYRYRFEAVASGITIPSLLIIRSFLKRPSAPNIPIQAIGLSLYEQLPSKDPSDPVETPGTKVTRTQWLDFSSLEISNLVGKNVLIVDEVDDTRTTLEYAVKELQKDVEAAAQKLEKAGKTRLCIFVLHNKDKTKRGYLPQDMMDEGRYLAARTVSDVWINYPWEATDIDEHDRFASSQLDY